MPDYVLNIDVERNGDSLPVTEAEFTRSFDQGTIGWQIVTPVPLDDIDTENDRFSLSLSVSGKNWYRFQDCVATAADVDESETSGGTTISGIHTEYDSDLLYYCAPKTVVFVNQNWLDRVFGGWAMKNGVPHYSPTSGPNASGRIGRRILHPRLPGIEFTDDMLAFKVGQWTHHGIAKYLAEMLGYSIIISTPDMPIMDTFTISSGTAWFDAIKENFTMWGANIQVMPPSGGSGNPTIYILDVINDSGGITPISSITIDPESVDKVNHEAASSGDSSEQIDYCIIMGRAGPENVIIEYPDMTPRTIPKYNWTPNSVVTSESKTDKIISRAEMPNYTGTLGVGDDEFSVTPIERFVTTQERYIGSDSVKGQQEVLLKETVDTIDNTGAVVHRVQVEHFFSQDFQPVGSTEKEWIYTNPPGTSNKSLMLAKIKNTDQQYYISALKLAMTTEHIQEQILADKVSNGKRDNANSLVGIKRIDRTRTAVDKNQNTNQMLFWMDTHFSTTFIDRTSDGTLLKRKIDYDLIAGTGKMSSQILHNPNPDVNKSTGDPFRREYTNGDPVLIGEFECYRKSTTISHQDICTDEIAEALAERAFYRRSQDVKNMSVKTSLPIPIGTLPVKVILHQLQRNIDISSAEDASTLTVALPPVSSGGGGDAEFFLKSITEKFSMANPDDTSSPDVTIEQTLELTTSL